MEDPANYYRFDPDEYNALVTDSLIQRCQENAQEESVSEPLSLPTPHPHSLPLTTPPLTPLTRTTIHFNPPPPPPPPLPPPPEDSLYDLPNSINEIEYGKMDIDIPDVRNENGTVSR